MDLIFPFLIILIGFAGLIWSADKFVYGASTTARNLGVSPLLIGLTIVAFGTSAPEIFTSGAAAIKGAPEIALGNALGSNIANIGLVLGITVLVCPLRIPLRVLKRELPALLLLTMICFFLLRDLYLGLTDGIALMLILLFFGWHTYRDSQRTPSSETNSEVADYIGDIPTPRALGWMLLGLGLMIFSSNILINAAREVALALGVSELVIGLTIVAIGTSLPELATTIACVMRRHHDLAIGNIIGSNTFNLLLVLPVPAFFSPFAFEPEALWRDYPVMLGLTCLLAFSMLAPGGKPRTVGRVSGSVFLLVYLTYTALLLSGQQTSL